MYKYISNNMVMDIDRSGHIFIPDDNDKIHNSTLISHEPGVLVFFTT